MINIKEKQDCCGCSACVEKCPTNCILLQTDEEGFWYPQINISACIKCGLCEKVCPVSSSKDYQNLQECYAAKHNNENIRINSSSGGIFSLLAEKIINEGGVVFGAAFDNEWKVRHKHIENLDEIKFLRGSKYVQSQIGDSYKTAESFLKKGRKVLFTGTPCQISGLNLFLRKYYPNLLTMDFVCHGVPSPQIWEKYLKELQIKKEEIKKISFRAKNTGWKKFSLTIEFLTSANKNKIHSSIYYKNNYMRAFLYNVSLRPSCYFCPVKSGKSGSDITVADLWKMNEIIPEIQDDDKGYSLVIINTPKGSQFKETDWIPVNFQDAISKNIAYNHSVSEPLFRNIFFNSIQNGANLGQALQKCKINKSFANKIFNKLKNIISK